MQVQSPVQSVGQQPLLLPLFGGHRINGTHLPIVPVGKKELALLAYLACTQPACHAREKLITLLWGSRFEKQARQSLRHALMSIRRALGFDLFLAKADAVSLRLHMVECDVGLFEALAGSNCGVSLDKAIELYKGPLLDELLIEEEAWREWLARERQRLEELALEVLLRRGHQLLASGQVARALELAQRATSINPFKEEANRLAMRASVAGDRRNEALRLYNELKVQLAKELSTKPDERTTRLFEAIRDGSYQPEMRSPAADAPEPVDTSPPTLSTKEIKEDIVPGGGEGGYASLSTGPHAVSPSVVKFPGQPHRRNRSSPRPDNTSQFDQAKRIERVSNDAPVIPGRVLIDENRLSMTVAAKAGNDRVGKSAVLDDIWVDNDSVSVEAQDDQVRYAKQSRARVLLSDGQPGGCPVSATRLSAIPAIAVIPFCTPSSSHAERVVGHLLADEIIASICRSPDLAAISRLSTQALSNLDFDFSDIATRLGADYALWGTPSHSGDSVRICLELVCVNSREIVWNDTVEVSVQSINNSCQIVVDVVVAATRAAMLTHETTRYQSQPMESLENYSLLLSAIALMHRTSKTGLDRAHKLLSFLSQRLPRHPLPHAWLAQLHLFRATLYRSENVVLDQQQALDFARRATDLDPECSIALAAEAWANLHVQKRFDIASDRLTCALQSNKSESTAWLLKGSMHAFMGNGDEAVSATEHARRLSPLDPRRSYYECLAATAYLSAERLDEAITLANKSLRANRMHASTWRVLIIGLVLSGRLDDARLAVPELLRLDPNLTVRGYLKRHPASDYPIGTTWAEALGKAGLPN
jgi:adenylate cyclase